MSNVVPLRRRLSAADLATAHHAGARTTGALVSDLVAVVAQLREASVQATGLPRPSLEIERTVQHLLDAVTAVERALDAATDDGEMIPF